MNRETYLRKIEESEKLVAVLHSVCAQFEWLPNRNVSSTYRAAISELHATQGYIDRTKKKIGIK
jgi:hypothetical protein